MEEPFKRDDQMIEDKPHNNGGPVDDSFKDEDKPRLTIRSLVLENFKSYAGRQEIGPFHSCFSAVVGPNGSGKSNVIDAVLFVFGKQAKTLRLNKVSDLIHKSDQYPDLQDCRVSVNFYDTIMKDGVYLPVEGSELTLTRTATAKNTSKYYMNDKPVTREVVVDLLKGRGVDLDNNRFLILQFEVEQIARMKPKGRNENETGLLEYLEDIIGTNKYVEPIEVTFKDLEALNEERTGRLQRLKLVQQEQQGLEEIKNEAEACLKLELSIIDKQSIVVQIDRLRSEKKSKVCEEKAKAIEEKLIAHREQMHQVSLSSKEIEKNYEAETKGSEKMAKALNDAKGKYTKFERQDIQLTEDKKHISKQLAKLQKDIATAEKTISTKQKLIKDNLEEIEECKQKAINLDEPLKKEEKVLEKMFEGIKDEVAPLHINLEKIQKELMPFQKNIDEAHARLDLSKNELSLFTSKSEKAREKLDKANVDIKTLSDTIAQKKKNLFDVRKEIGQGEKDLQNAEGELRSLSGADTTLLKEISKARTKADEANRLLGQEKSQNKIIRELMKLKKKELPGIYGRLGNLGTIENLEKYDVAISTACTRLDNIVVDTMETAQKCIEFLRTNNIGRATFIALDKIQNFQSRMNKIQTPDHSERLFDLIQVHDEAVRVAFYFALQDTLVTDTIDRASSIAYGVKRWRVVTLDGKIIDISGTMSGGGSNPARGGMTKSVQANSDPEALKKIALENNEIVDKKNAELLKLQEKFSSLEHLVEQLSNSLIQKKKTIPKLELDINEISKQLRELEARIPELKEGCQSSDAEEKNIDKVRQSVEKDEKDLVAAKKKAEKLLNQIAEIQESIENAGGKKLKDQKVKVEKMSKAIEEANETATKLEVANTAATSAITKSEKAIKKDTKTVEQMTIDLEKKESEIAELLHAAGDVLQKRDELEQLYNEKIDELKKIRNAYEKAKKEFAEFRSTEVDYTNQLEDALKIVEENAKKASFSAAKLDKFRTKKLASRVDETDEVDLPIFTEEELAQYDSNELIAEITQSKLELSNLKPNLAAIKEWRMKHTEFETRKHELDEITEQRDGKRKTYEELRKKRLDEFMEGFNIIRRKLAEMYKMITLDDGDADLEPNDNLDPFSEGISFRVRPPKKTWKYIYNLSGGEMTLSSLALVFALHTYKPTPIYIMDEIDAALDFKNVSIVANYIKERTKNAQFIIVSLRNFMFEVADRLVGIYKTQNCTKSITINPGTFLKEAEEEQKPALQPQKQLTQKASQKPSKKAAEMKAQEKENVPEKEKGPGKQNEIVLEDGEEDGAEADEEEHTKKKQKVQGAKKKNIK